MGLRELKETAHKQFVRGRFAQCAQTYQQILRLAPKDPNMRVRHAEACRRAGEQRQAIDSYRAAAELLLELGCESRARGALRAALELDPRDPVLQAEIARLDPHPEEAFSPSASEQDALPLLPPLESGLDPVPPAPLAPHILRGMRPEVLLQTPALPRIHRALPSAPSVPPLVPPVLLPAPRVPCVGAASPTEKMGTALASAAGGLAPRAQPAPSLPPRSVTMGAQARAARPVAPPILYPSGNPGVQAPASTAPASNSRAPSQAPRSVPVPPPPPPKALLDAAGGLPLAPPAPKSGPRLEVRRLSATSLAFRSSPNDSWAVIRSQTPLEMHLVENLDQLPPMLSDFTVDITVENPAEAASDTVH